MEEEYFNYKLRVPSQMDVATPENLWKFIQILPNIPDTFENIDVSNIKEYPLNNEDAIARTLAYLKYLDVLTEERTKRKVGDKKTNQQYFHLTDKGQELKKTAILEPDRLYTKWKQIIKESELYKSLITNEEFEKYDYISKLTLRKLLSDSFSKKVKDIKGRVDKSEDYLINFLKEMELFSFDGNFLKPMGINSNKIQEETIQQEEKSTHTEHEKDISKIEDSKTDDKEIKEGYTHIRSHGHFDLNIRKNSSSLKVLKSYLTALEVEIEAENESDEGKNEKQ